jgi:fructokinase
MALMSEPSRGATLGAVEEARARGALVSVDPNLRPSSWRSLEEARNAIRPLLDGADVVKVNDDEAHLLTGEDSLEEAGARVGREDSLRVVTLGGAGCRWWWRGESGAIPAPTVMVQDTTGAGDAFVGALLAELARLDVTSTSFRRLRHEDLEACLRFACAAASLSCSRAGAMASLPTRSDVQALL